MLTLVIDDETLFRKGLLHLLYDLDDQIEFIDCATCEQALAKGPRIADVQLVLLDYKIPGGGLTGLDALAAMRQACPKAMVVIMSSHHRRSQVREVIDADAAGFIPKDCSEKMLLTALRFILDGGIFLPSDTLDDDIAPPEQADALLEQLSPRQYECLQLAIQGISNRSIGERLHVAEATVKSHLSASYRALGVSNRTEAVYEAARLGLRTQPARA